MRRILAGLGVLLLTPPLSARTVILTAEDCDEMAAIVAFAPRLSWVTTGPGNAGLYHTQPSIYWTTSKMALLMRFPFQDLLPKGQRITKAELTLMPNYVTGGPSIHVRRILAEWGTGVCHDFRMTYPKKVEWAQPGGRGAATDRAAKDSAVFKFAKAEAVTADVTEDVELWYTGGATNRGWIFTKETDVGIVYLPSPYAPHTNGGKQWKLQITYEPQ